MADLVELRSLSCVDRSRCRGRCVTRTDLQRRLAAYGSTVRFSGTVRPARREDVAQLAHGHVRWWQETYRGLMSDAVFDDPGLLPARERFWTAVLTDERYGGNRVAVAERDGVLVGVAMSGTPLDAGAAWARQLYVLYVRAADHGRGAGPALLQAVIDPEDSVALWVADPNPRAQAFYRKHGFVDDGTTQLEDGVRELRMVRGCSTADDPADPGSRGRAGSPDSRTTLTHHAQLPPVAAARAAASRDPSHRRLQL